MEDLSGGNSFSIKELNLLKHSEKKDNIVFETEEHTEGKYYEFDRKSNFILGDMDGQKVYDPKTILKNSYWGQLKLFLSEFYTLLYHLKDSEITDILYIGAAPGEHIYVLAHLFEDYTYHLYDMCSFDKRLQNMKNIRIHKKYFDDAELKKWKSFDRKIFLISDIRTLTYSASATGLKYLKENEKAVLNDMKLQEKWVKELEPEVSLLKFRLPFPHEFILKEQGKILNYLDGTILKQAYNKPSSSETRLLVKDIISKDYDIVKYERQLFYQNSEIRNKLKFKNPINNQNKPIYEKKGLLNSYDETCLTVLVIDFIKSIGYGSRRREC